MIPSILVSLLASPDRDPVVGWVEVPESKALKIAADINRPSYEVFLRNGEARVEERTVYVAELRAQPRPQPKGMSIRYQVGDGVKRTWYPGSGIKVHGGELIADDHGEWRGGIGFADPKTLKVTPVSTRNTRPLMMTSQGIFGIQSNDHMMDQFCDLVQVEWDNGKWSVRTIASYNKVFRKVIPMKDRFLIADEARVAWIFPSGAESDIYRFSGELSVGCMIVDSRNTIWLGSNGCILRIRMVNSKATAQWLVPRESVRRRHA